MEVECSICLKLFNRKPSKVKEKNYCSDECFHKSLIKLETTTCATCNKTIQKLPSDIRKSKTGNVFCDHTCSAIYSNEHRAGYGITQYRMQALKAFENKCNRCGFDTHKSILEVHHKDRNRKNNSLDNLEILCPNCHSLDHFLAKDGKFSLCS